MPDTLGYGMRTAARILRKVLFQGRLWLALRAAPRGVQIRPLRVGEALLAEAMPGGRPADLQRRRLALQQADTVLYLFAWQGPLPIGHLVLWWSGVEHKPAVPSLAGTADLSDLYVVPAYRSRGIGTLLMDAAEAAAARRGFTHLGLDVAIDNPRARVFYERRGYRDSGLGERTVQWTEVDPHGVARQMSAVDVYLVKPLLLSGAVPTAEGWGGY